MRAGSRLFALAAARTAVAAVAFRGVATPAAVARTAVAAPIAAFQRLSFGPVYQPARWMSADANWTLKTPPMGDSISEGTVVKWIKAEGDSVEMDEVVLQIETDKITVDVRASKAGTLIARKVPAGTVVPVGADLADFGPASAAPKAAPKAAAAPAPEAPKAAAPAPAPASAPAPAPAPAPKAAAPAPAPAAAPVKGSAIASTRVAMSPMRKRIAARLKDSQNQLAMLTTFQECDMYNLKTLREKFGEEFAKKHGVKLGFMSCFVAAATKALQAVPVINATIDGGDIVYHNHVDISVAVAAPKGLVVPVVRNTPAMSFAAIEKEIARLGQRAKTGELTMEEMAGGTFTISNGGVYGSLLGTPIVNPPQSAILGMHGINDKPHVVNGQIVIRPIMMLALSYDHRLIDGREAVTFLKHIKASVEDPSRLLLDL